MILKILPLSVLSRVVGILVQLKLPSFLQRRLNQSFVRFFGIDMSEALVETTDSYPSLQEIFIRPLKPSARHLPTDGGLFVSPADGVVNISAPAEPKGEAIQKQLQVKCLKFSLAALIGLEEGQKDFSPAWYTTVYLAPHNYHRVHSPVTGRLESADYLPGKFFPVNRFCTDRVPRLYVQNERLVFKININGAQNALCYVVMVGALNVARMSSPFLEKFFSSSAFFPTRKNFPLRRNINAMQELGTFMLGSTVVLVLNKEAAAYLHPEKIDHPRAILLGAPLCSR